MTTTRKLTPAQAAVVKAMAEGARLELILVGNFGYRLSTGESVSHADRIALEIQPPLIQQLPKRGDTFKREWELSPAGIAAAKEMEHE